MTSINLFAIYISECDDNITSLIHNNIHVRIKLFLSSVFNDVLRRIENHIFQICCIWDETIFPNKYLILFW